MPDFSSNSPEMCSALAHRVGEHQGDHYFESMRDRHRTSDGKDHRLCGRYNLYQRIGKLCILQRYEVRHEVVKFSGLYDKDKHDEGSKHEH